MTNLPTAPPVVHVTTVYPTTQGMTEDLGDWSVDLEQSTLKHAVPAKAHRTVITLHSHQIVIERQDGIYRTLSIVENGLLIASSIFLISISAASVLFALSAISSVTL